MYAQSLKLKEVTLWILQEEEDWALNRQFDGWTLRETRLWLSWLCLEPVPVSAACQLHGGAECQLCHFITN